MAEDDEIDILGDGGLESFIPEKEALFSNNASGTLDDSILVSDCDTLLEFEYTVHPQWLSDKPSANWYENLTGILEPPAPSKSTSVTEQHSTDGCGWTDMEKILLNRGIEIFGKSATNLAQIIGSKTETEVKHYLRHYYSATENFKDNIILDDLSMQDYVYTVENNDTRVLLEDIEIPASMEEEVISTVSSTSSSKRTKPSNKPKQKHSSISFKDIPSGQSLLKKNHMEPTHNPQKKSHLPHKHKMGAVKKTKPPKKNPKVKFKIKGAILKNYNNNVRRSKKKSETLSSTESETSNGGHENTGSKETPALLVRQVITTGEGLSVPFCEGEKIIRIKKESDFEDSDTEIDIEDSSDEQPSTSNSLASSRIKLENCEDNTEDEPEAEVKTENTTLRTILKKELDMSQLSEEEINTLMGMECPDAEYVIEDLKINNLEKFINYDFFVGFGANTPERYLKIRTHILNTWRKTKPAYVTKTSIRPGLKNCGDVKYISKVHTFLEQIGAINFNCGISYIRPLYDLINVPTSSPKQKKVVESSIVVPRNKHDRHRHKQKMINFNDGQGGYTTQHDDEGEVMNTTIVNEDRKKRTVKKHVPLISCRSFPAESPQQYKVQIDLSTLLIMDLHAHASLSEVMGLIGGHWDETRQLLTINKYEPCKNIASSTMHCEMCPVSQSTAAGNIHSKSLQILGWFHSHPTGAPEPSQQDIDTQLSVQRYITKNNPCVGVIMSPFSAHGALIASPFRCMVVGRNFNNEIVPYKLSVAVDDTNLNVEELLSSAKGIFYSNYVDKVTRRVNFSKPYFQNDSISYLDKFISSVKMHLAKCSNINKMTCDEIVDKLSIVCTMRT